MRSFILIALFTGLSGCAGMATKAQYMTLDEKSEHLCSYSKKVALEYSSKEECVQSVRKNLGRAELYKHNSTHDICLNPEIAVRHKDYDECFSEVNKIKERMRIADAKLENRRERQAVRDQARQDEYADGMTAGFQQLDKGIARAGNAAPAQPIQANCTTTTFGNQTQTNCN